MDKMCTYIKDISVTLTLALMTMYYAMGRLTVHVVQSVIVFKTNMDLEVNIKVGKSSWINTMNWEQHPV